MIIMSALSFLDLCFLLSSPSFINMDPYGPLIFVHQQDYQENCLYIDDRQLLSQTVCAFWGVGNSKIIVIISYHHQSESDFERLWFITCNHAFLRFAWWLYQTINNKQWLFDLLCYDNSSIAPIFRFVHRLFVHRLFLVFLSRKKGRWILFRSFFLLTTMRMHYTSLPN